MKKTLIFLLVGMMTILPLTGCKRNLPTGNEEGVETPQMVKIGVIAPLSGPASIYGTDAINAYTYIVDKFNASQSDFSIQLIIEDGKCEGKDAISAAQKLINVDRVQVIVGGLCSSETLAAGKIAQQYNIPMISPISSAPEISEIGDALFKFYDDRDLTKNLANYVNSLQVKKVVALMEQSDSPVAFVNAFAEYFSGEVVKMSTLPTEKDFTLLAKQLKSNIISSDFVLFVASNSAFLIDGLRAFDKEGILTMMEGNIAGNEQMLGNDVLTNAELGNKLNGIKGVQLKSLSSFASSGKMLADIFQSRFTINSDILFMILEAEAMDVTLEAIQKKGNNAEAIKAYFTALNSKNVKSGYFGDYYFNAERTAEGLGFLVYEIQDGKLAEVK